YKIINKELHNYSQKLSELPQIIILTKCDLLKEKELKEKIKNFKESVFDIIRESKINNIENEEKLENNIEQDDKAKNIDKEKNNSRNQKAENENIYFELPEILPISSISNLNIEKLKDMIWEKLEKLPKTQSVQVEEFEFDKRDKVSLDIVKNSNGSFELKGGYIDNLIRGIVLSDFISFAYFQKRLKNDGVIDKLKEKGLKHGDTIHIKDVKFDYIE
ncbi:MAG: Obg family GTPase CgtA, partial [Clostridia bacterium]|nr:Obg family GTPase CgtA [Clostridia bacterium]